MRIAVVGGMSPNPEGEAHYTAKVSRALAEVAKHAEIRVFAHCSSSCSRSEQLYPNLSVERVTHGYHPLRRHLAPLYLWRPLRRFRPDVVHFQAPQKKLYGGVGGEPLLWLFRYLRRRQVPVVITLHALWTRKDFIELAAERGWSSTTRRFIERLYRNYLRTVLITVPQVNALVSGDNNPLLNEIPAEWQLPKTSLVAEPHPCDAPRYLPSETAAAKAALALTNYRVVLAFGFVRPDKGFHYLMQAVAPLVHHDTQLVVIIAGHPSGAAGDAYAQQLLALHAQLGSPAQIRLQFEYLPDNRLQTYLQACDVLVVPYTRVMGASGPMHHAFSYGKPVVATAVGQNRGLSDVCMLVPPHNPEALREALRQILYSDGCWEAYHQRTVQYAASHTWQHLAQRYLADYERLACGGGH